MRYTALIPWDGFAVLVLGVILSNRAVWKMSKILKLGWTVKSDVRSRNVIAGYRESYEDGPLYRDLKFAYWLAGIGAAIFIGSSFLSRNY
ncbi:MAG: hypothetical protein ABI197_02520 [Granulicella sp.]